MGAREDNEVIVIGGGAAGLGVAVALQRRGIDVIVLDRAGAVGSSWRGRYDGLRLNTVRGLSGLAREPIPRSAGTWPTREAFTSYLEDVVERKRLDVRLGVEVERIDRGDGHWTLLTSSGSLRARFVVVATGYDRVPRVPDWPGVDSFFSSTTLMARSATLAAERTGPIRRAPTKYTASRPSTAHTLTVRRAPVRPSSP